MEDTTLISPIADEIIPHFSYLDYSLFTCMLLISLLVGVYYGFIEKSQNVNDYLLGGQTMATLPVALSLVASFISGITVLGVPADVYIYGTQYFALVFLLLPVALIVAYCILPVFYDLQYTTSFEYLEHRFGRSARQVISLLFGLTWLLYIPIVVYVPCLALSQVTAININAISPVVAVVCIFYTSVGGLKAVVWTDTLQMLILLISIITIILLGVINIGGFGVIFERSAAGSRLELFNLDTSLYSRSTLLSVFSFYFTSCMNTWGTSPCSVQRYLSVPSLSDARRTVFLLAFGVSIIVTLAVFTGLLMFATYHDCDPIITKAVSKHDQILPYYVMDVGRKLPGLAGLFVAGVFSAALSTMSTGLNTLSATVYKDFVEHILPHKLSERNTHLSMKVISLVIGAFCFAMMFVVEKLGGVLQVAISLGSVCNGAEVGIFLLGMFVPWANLKGALAGVISSIVTMSVIVTGASVAQAKGLARFPRLPTRTDGCSSNVTDWVVLATAQPLSDSVFPLFRISFFYFAITGLVVTLLVGVVVSFLTGPTNPADIDPRYLSPVVRNFFRRRDARMKTTSPSELHEVPLKNIAE